MASASAPGSVSKRKLELLLKKSGTMEPLSVSVVVDLVVDGVMGIVKAKEVID